MVKPQGRVLGIVGSIVTAAVVILFLWVALNQPVPANTQTPSSPGNPSGGTPAVVPPTTPPSGGGSGSTPGGGTVPPSTPPPALGNGRKVPGGWSHAHCADLPADAQAHGQRARCSVSATYGAMKKAGIQQGSFVPFAERASAPATARGTLTASDHGHSVATGTNPGHHAGWVKLNA